MISFSEHEPIIICFQTPLIQYIVIDNGQKDIIMKSFGAISIVKVRPGSQPIPNQNRTIFGS